MGDEENREEEVINTDSILDSVKKLLGIDSSLHSFDVDIIVNINSAIATLTQLGIGPENGYLIVDNKNTYQEFLGKSEPMYQQVKLYLYLKTRIGFDPSSSSYALSSMNEQIKELEFRMKTLNEQLNNFKT